MERSISKLSFVDIEVDSFECFEKSCMNLSWHWVCDPVFLYLDSLDSGLFNILRFNVYPWFWFF